MHQLIKFTKLHYVQQGIDEIISDILKKKNNKSKITNSHK